MMHFMTAGDAKQRQHWVTRLRATAEHHTELLTHERGGGSSGNASPLSSTDGLSKSQESLKYACTHCPKAFVLSGADFATYVCIML